MTGEDDFTTGAFELLDGDVLIRELSGERIGAASIALYRRITHLIKNRMTRRKLTMMRGHAGLTKVIYEAKAMVLKGGCS